MKLYCFEVQYANEIEIRRFLIKHATRKIVLINGGWR